MARLAVAGLSVRALAESARAGGFTVVGLDAFGDRDTRAACVAWRRIGDALRIEPVAFQAALHELAPDVIGWVPGGGFEDDPALLEAGGDALPCFGLGPEIVRRVRDPRRFFAALDAHGIGHPETVFAPPADPRGWLAKRAGGCGGTHVEPAPGAGAADAYWQRLQPGDAMSALFLADGERAGVVGLNRQFVQALGPLPYVYAGAVGPVAAAPAVRAAVDAALAALVPEFGLRGLCSLDFLVDGDAVAVLELNPRPSATMQLYPDVCPGGLVRAHLQALTDPLPVLAEPRLVRGHRVVFANAPRDVDDALSHALAGLGAHDVPVPGTRIGAGEPVCSVSAAAGSVASAQARLAERVDAVEALLAAGTGLRPVLVLES